MISVCIATHNGEKYIEEQIDSILRQLSTDDEIIISDDGSNDKTIDILLGMRDSRIHIFSFQQPTTTTHVHKYVCRNFENALKHARGEFVFLSDQDDYWMPNKVEICKRALFDHTLVVHQADLCNGSLQSKGLLMYNDQFVFKNYLSIKRGKYYGCTLAFRRELLNKILPFPNNLVIHDQWIGCIAELSGSVYYEREPLIRYRLHDDNTSGGKSHNSLWFRFIYRVDMFFNIIKRMIYLKNLNKNKFEQK